MKVPIFGTDGLVESYGCHQASVYNEVCFPTTRDIFCLLRVWIRVIYNPHETILFLDNIGHPHPDL